MSVSELLEFLNSAERLQSRLTSCFDNTSEIQLSEEGKGHLGSLLAQIIELITSVLDVKEEPQDEEVVYLDDDEIDVKLEIGESFSPESVEGERDPLELEGYDMESDSDHWREELSSSPTISGSSPAGTSTCGASSVWKRKKSNAFIRVRKMVPLAPELADFNNRVRNFIESDLKNATGPPFKCPFCAKTCSRRFSLKEHLLTHIKGEYAICPVCEKQIKANALKGHVFHQHREVFPEHYGKKAKPFRPEKYGWKVQDIDNPGNLKKPFKCPVCGIPEVEREKALAHADSHSMYFLEESGLDHRKKGKF